MPWKPRVTVASVIEHESRFLMVEETFDLLEPEPVAGYQIDPDITAVHWLTRDEINAQKPQVWRSELVGRSLDAYAAGVRHSLDSLQYFRVDQ